MPDSRLSDEDLVAMVASLTSAMTSVQSQLDYVVHRLMALEADNGNLKAKIIETVTEYRKRGFEP